MKVYEYAVRDARGKLLHGFEFANDEHQLKRKLAPLNCYFSSAKAIRRKAIFQKKVGLQALLVFTHRLSSLVEAGIPIISAFDILWRQTEDVTLQLVVSRMRARIGEGSNISEAMNDFPKVFPQVYRALIAVAEEAGELVLVFQKLSDYLESQKVMTTRIKKATTYPIIVISMALIIMLGMFIFIVPVFEKFLTQMKVELPALTKGVLVVSKALRSPVFVIGALGVIGMIVLIYQRFASNVKLIRWKDNLKLKLPVFGDILYTIYVSRFISALSMLTSTGLPILKAFEAAKQTISNYVLSRSVDDIARKVEQGAPLQDAFESTNVFPVMLVEMIGIGEKTGNLPNILIKVTKHFDDEVDYKISRLVALMEPLLIVIVGGIVITVLLAIYLPIISIWQGIGKS